MAYDRKWVVALGEDKRTLPTRAVFPVEVSTKFGPRLTARQAVAYALAYVSKKLVPVQWVTLSAVLKSEDITEDQIWEVLERKYPLTTGIETDFVSHMATSLLPEDFKRDVFAIEEHRLSFKSRVDSIKENLAENLSRVLERYQEHPLLVKSEQEITETLSVSEAKAILMEYGFSVLEETGEIYPLFQDTNELFQHEILMNSLGVRSSSTFIASSVGKYTNYAEYVLAVNHKALMSGVIPDNLAMQRHEFLTRYPQYETRSEVEINTLSTIYRIIMTERPEYSHETYSKIVHVIDSLLRLPTNGVAEYLYVTPVKEHYQREAFAMMENLRPLWKEGKIPFLVSYMLYALPEGLGHIIQHVVRAYELHARKGGAR